MSVASPASKSSLPLTNHLCLDCSTWLKTHFDQQFTHAVAGTPFEKELLFAIACQETAIVWCSWTSSHSPQEILARCVFDASGDANGTRVAFPTNTAAFVAKYGQTIANTLIAEANATRALHGWGPKPWVYAGYGLFQYDIQNILTDPDFFEKKLWYNMDDCLLRVIKELKIKWALHPNDIFNTVRSYNGAGPRAENYAQNVMQFLAWIKQGNQ